MEGSLIPNFSKNMVITPLFPSKIIVAKLEMKAGVISGIDNIPKNKEALGIRSLAIRNPKGIAISNAKKVVREAIHKVFMVTRIR
jgi:hypothetical protein